VNLVARDCVESEILGLCILSAIRWSTKECAIRVFIDLNNKPVDSHWFGKRSVQMPFQVLSHPVELPDLLFSIVFEFSDTSPCPLLWIFPVRSFLLNGYIVFFDNVNGSESITNMSWRPAFTHLPDRVFNVLQFKFTKSHRSILFSIVPEPNTSLLSEIVTKSWGENVDHRRNFDGPFRR